MSARASLPIETWLLLDTLESGKVLARAVAGPSLVAYASPADAVLQHQLALGVHLKRAGAATQAAFSLPDAELVHVDVEVPHPTAPRSVARPIPLSVPCVVLPHRRDRWAVALPHGLTVFVGPKESLDEVLKAEVQRYLHALAPDATALLALMSARERELSRVTVEVDRRALPGAAARALRRRVDDARRRAEAKRVLGAIGRRVVPEDVRGPDPVGQEAPGAILDALLGGEARRSVLLVGESRVGKTTLVQRWLRAKGEDAPFLYATSGAQLVAGMSGAGQWQARVERVLAAAETLDAVLWLDDLRDLLGDHAGAYVDLPSAIRPWLDDGRVRVVGELTPEAADLFATRHPGLFASMHPLRLEPQDARAGRAALEACIEYAARREPQRANLDRGAIGAVVELTDRFLPYRAFPGKAVRLFEELRASAERAHHAEAKRLRAEDVYALFSAQTGVPELLLRDDVAWRRERARAFFARRIVGQADAVDRLVDTLAVVKAGLAPGDKPLASFLFAGPTGVGKTALCRALAELLFGSAERLVRFDMSEMADPGAATRLVHGSASGEGQLTSAVRQQPFCVVLLDEIEKAHPSVFDLLLGVLGEGRLTDARGRTAYFHDAIVVMTSNLGTRHRSRAVGIDPPAVDEGARYLEAVEGWFRPELVNRIDRVIPFAPLSRGEIRAIAGLTVERLAMRRGLVELGATLEVSEAALDALSDGGFEAAYGARALRRHLEDALVAPLARALGPLGAAARNARLVVRGERDPAPEGGRLHAETRDGLVYEILRGPPRSAREDAALLARVSATRRWAHETREVPTAAELRERAQYLLAEVSYGDGVRGTEAAMLQSELAGLRERLDAVDAAVAEIESIEELSVVASLAGEPVSEMAALVGQADLTFRAALLELLIANDERHAITVRVQEHDGQRPLNRWLGGLLEARERLGWQILGHVEKDPAPKPADWPTERRWGPPRDADALAHRLAQPDRGPLALLLRVRGRHAGHLLALEAGLHRYRGHEGATPATFVMTTLRHAADLPDDALDSPRLHPEPIPSSTRRRLLPAVREHEGEVLTLAGGATLTLSLAEYWARLEAIALTHLLWLERSGRADASIDVLAEDEDEEGEAS